jgi:hypothetical protein
MCTCIKQVLKKNIVSFQKFFSIKGDLRLEISVHKLITIEYSKFNIQIEAFTYIYNNEYSIFQ